jgi:hypothetical protein
MAKDIKVFFVKGTSYSISMKGEKKDLTKGDFLIEGDTLITGKKSFIVLKIEGHSTYKVEESSEITVNDLAYTFKDSNELDQGANLFVRAGTLFSKVKKTKGKKSLTVETKNTTMGVRGTEFLVNVDRITKDLILAVRTGEVVIENQLSKEKEILTEKQSVFVEKDKTFSQPKKYEWLEKVSWDMTKNSNGSSFSKHKKRIHKEIIKNKRPWIRNEVRFQQKEMKWNKDETIYRKRIVKLKPREIKLQRQKNRDRFIKKSPKDLANGVNNKTKLIRNNFADQKVSNQSERRSQLRKKARARALERMKNKTRRRYRPGQTPVQNTVPNPPNPTGGDKSL